MRKVKLSELGCCNTEDPLSRASLVYENTNRLGLMTVDYYGKLQPYYHALFLLMDHGTTWCRRSSYVRLFISFMCLDPLGSTNYGKLTNVQLNVETQSNLATCGGGGAEVSQTRLL